MPVGREKWYFPVNSIFMVGTVCNICCPSAEALSTHLETEHLGSGKGSYTCLWENCTRCQKPFTQRQKAIRHIRTHTGLKAYKVPLPFFISNRSATSVVNPSPHKKSYHNIYDYILNPDHMHVLYAINDLPPRQLY